jgi:hypothetical protein
MHSAQKYQKIRQPMNHHGTNIFDNLRLYSSMNLAKNQRFEFFMSLQIQKRFFKSNISTVTVGTERRVTGHAENNIQAICMVTERHNTALKCRLKIASWSKSSSKTLCSQNSIYMSLEFLPQVKHNSSA